MDTLQQVEASARGVAVVDKTVTDAELEKMHKAGVRGIRFNIVSGGAANNNETIMTLSQRAHQLGWHVSFWMTADDTVNGRFSDEIAFCYCI